MSQFRSQLANTGHLPHILTVSQRKPCGMSTQLRKVIYKCAVATTKPDETPPHHHRGPSHLVDICSSPVLQSPALLASFISSCVYTRASLSKLIVLISWLVVAFARLIHSTFHCITTNPFPHRMCSPNMCASSQPPM